jgi:2'-5' RNA ligase
MIFDDRAPQQLSLNLGLQPERPRPAPKLQQRADLFFAIYLDAAAAAGGAKLARRLCDQLPLSGRPRPQETLHVTLAPVGVAASLSDAVFSALRRAAALVDQPAFQVIFDRVSSFKMRGNYALVLRCGEGLSALTTLHKSLRSAMAGVGFRAPSGFTPHVTLAYSRGSVSETALAEPIIWTVREFVLAQSLLGEGIHMPLARWPLRG